MMKRFVPILIILICSYMAVRPLFMSGFFPMHDDTQVARVITMGRAIKEGQFPVRWVSDLGYGYGYPIFNFYAPLPYYFGGILYALGVPALIATKIMFGVGIVLPSITMYLAVFESIGVFGAIVASIYYLFTPYHAVQIYVRGAVGEYWILIFWPLVIYGLLGSQRKHVSQSILWGSIGLAGSMLSHTLLGYATVVITSVGLLVYWLARWVMHRPDKKGFVTHIIMMVLGLGLSAFFWLPALIEMGSTNVSAQVNATANYADHFVCLMQLWTSQWGFGGSARGCTSDGLSFMLGKLNILLALASIVIWKLRPRKPYGTYLWLATTAALVGIVLTLQVSAPVWHVLPKFAFMQYPWRFLSLATFGLSLLAGYAVHVATSTRGRIVLACAVVGMVVLMDAKWFVPQYVYTKDSKAFETREDIRWRVSKISDEYLPASLPRPNSESEIVSDTIVSGVPIGVTPIFMRATESRIAVESSTSAEITLNIASFPGWTYSINGIRRAPLLVKGLPTFRIDAGQSVVAAIFIDTPIRTIANSVTALTFIFGALAYVNYKKTKR